MCRTLQRNFWRAHIKTGGITSSHYTPLHRAMSRAHKISTGLAKLSRWMSDVSRPGSVNCLEIVYLAPYWHWCLDTSIRTHKPSVRHIQTNWIRSEMVAEICNCSLHAKRRRRRWRPPFVRTPHGTNILYEKQSTCAACSDLKLSKHCLPNHPRNTTTPPKPFAHKVRKRATASHWCIRRSKCKSKYRTLCTWCFIGPGSGWYYCMYCAHWIGSAAVQNSNTHAHTNNTHSMG